MNLSIGIIGHTGKMGQFFQNFFESKGFSVEGFSRKSTKTLEEFCHNKDIIFLSVPIDKTEEMIQKVGPFLNKNQCLSDFTSIKKFPLESMLLHTKAEVFGTHPMFGPTLSGDIKGQNFVFCEGRGKKYYNIFYKIFTSSGARITEINAEKHDHLMTIIQGLSHFLDVSFAHALKKSGINLKDIFQVSSPAYELKMSIIGRTLAQDANLYGNIQIANPKNPTTLHLFLESAKQLLKIIETKNIKTFETYFQDAKDHFGEYAELSKKESDEVIEFWAHTITKQKEKPYSFQKKKQEDDEENIGILGPENTFSHLAFQKFFQKEKKCKMYPSLSNLFSDIKKGMRKEAFVPMENLLHGSITESIDGIMKGDIPIVAIYEMPIYPCLFIKSQTKKEEIYEIFSHPQALAQCSNYLEKNFPKATITATSSTSASIQMAKNKKNTAAIGAPELIGKDEEIICIAENIANEKNNATRFVYLSNTPFLTISDYYEGAIMFSFAKDSPGSLESVLHDFSSENINLTKIESRPTGKFFGEYVFFMTFEGKISEQKKKRILEKISSKTALCKFLGNYPVIKHEKSRN